MGWSIPILRVAGIQLRIHITFLLLIAWIAFAYYTPGRLVRSGRRGLVHSVVVRMRGVARVRARFGGESFRNQHA